MNISTKWYQLLNKRRKIKEFKYYFLKSTNGYSQRIVENIKTYLTLGREYFKNANR